MAKELLIKQAKPAGAALAAFLVWLIVFNVYTDNNLAGDKSKAILSSNYFGTPEHLVEKNKDPTYVGKNEFGWDGQFHYYIANDWLNKEGTSQNVDNAPYRFARPGIAPIVWLLQKAASEYNWPSEYIYLQGIIIALGTYSGYRLLERESSNGIMIFAWCLWPGLFFSSFNGLPDALADSFFLIGMNLKRRNNIASGIVIALATLSREAYLAYPILLITTELLQRLRTRKAHMISEKRIEIVSSIIPVTIFTLWKLAKTEIIGPVTNTGEVYGNPWSLVIAVSNAIRDNDQVLGLACHIILIIAGIVTAIKLYRKTKRSNSINSKDPTLGLALASTLAIISLGYLWLGHTVLFHYTGYLKADQVLIVFILLSQSKAKSIKMETNT